jgi:hypothetical protein
MYLTEEEMNLVTDIHDNHEVEFRKWADENESQLMKWYDENPNYSLFEGTMKFAHYCATEFMKRR